MLTRSCVSHWLHRNPVASHWVTVQNRLFCMSPLPSSMGCWRKNRSVARLNTTKATMAKRKATP